MSESSSTKEIERPIETKTVPIPGFTEGLRKKELQRISEKLAKDSWELSRYHENGMTKSTAIFQRYMGPKEAF